MVEAGFPISMAAALLTLLLVGVAEWLHLRRVARVKTLAFGPSGRPSHWARLTPLLRTLACTSVSWALSVLLFVTPRVHDANVVQPEDYRHVVLVLDVSPSMRLQDGGPERDQSRMQRASDVMESFFKRVAIQQYKMSVVAVYSSAKPVVVETNDVDVVRNILNDLPMHYAFPVGKTDLFSGLNEAAGLSKGWQPKSTTVIVISDGDTVPATGMPTMPASVSNVVVVGIGDPITGQFIDGRQSRQDAATLRQIDAPFPATFAVLLWGIASVEPIGFGSWGGSLSQHGGVGGAGTLTPTWHEEVLWSSSWVGDLGKVTPLSPFLAVSFCSERR